MTWDEFMQESYTPTSPIPTPDGPARDRLLTELEPDQEMVPPTPAPPTPEGAHRVSELQEAMRRSVNRLDGHPRRNRSRSPRANNTPPTAMFCTQNSKQKQQAESFSGFLARRTPKKAVKKKKGNKELNYGKSDDALRHKIDQARAKEWQNWSNFDACDVIPPDKAKDFLDAHPDAQVLPTRWVDVDKSDGGEEAFLKSRLVVRGDLEKDNEYRTDSPTASHLMLSLILSFCACFNLNLHCGDITAAFLQGFWFGQSAHPEHALGWNSWTSKGFLAPSQETSLWNKRCATWILASPAQNSSPSWLPSRPS